jgi:hypothetical protein
MYINVYIIQLQGSRGMVHKTRAKKYKQKKGNRRKDRKAKGHRKKEGKKYRNR